MEALLRVVVLCALGVLISGQEDNHPQVETQYGKLQGKTLTVKGTNRTVHAFYAVPFAQPAVGSLRLAAPKPPMSWSSIRDATEYAPMCPQDTKSMEQYLERVKTKFPLPPVSDDCLYLNVFTPADRLNGEKLPVKVMGRANMFEEPALDNDDNPVSVTIQFRLGILGYFNSENDRAAANYGFEDQVAALRWVQENIADFGGDPIKVTISGQSAGGMSVSALVESPLAKGLFHKAILESEVVTAPGVEAKSAEESVSVSN